MYLLRYLFRMSSRLRVRFFINCDPHLEVLMCQPLKLMLLRDIVSIFLTWWCIPVVPTGVVQHSNFALTRMAYCMINTIIQKYERQIL